MLNTKGNTFIETDRITKASLLGVKAETVTDSYQKLTLYLEALDKLYAIDKNFPQNYRTLAYRAFAYLIENFALDWNFLYLIRDAYEQRANEIHDGKTKQLVSGLEKTYKDTLHVINLKNHTALFNGDIRMLRKRLNYEKHKYICI